MSTKIKLAIVAALKEELAAVHAAIPNAEERGVMVLRGGVGWNAAVHAAKGLASAWEAPPLVCATGYCGALIPELAVGDVVVSEFLLGPHTGERYHCDEPRLTAVREALARENIRCQHGAIVTLDAPVFFPAAKRALGLERGALAVDMESFAFAANVNQAETRVFALRVVSDTVDEELPPEIGELFGAQGELKAASAARFFMQHPAKALALKKRADQAAQVLTKAWQAVLPALI